MQASVVFPLHDPEGVILPHLKAISPDLKSAFTRAYVGITPITYERSPEAVSALERDGFFAPSIMPAGALVGEQVLHLYWQAAIAAPPSQILHLCFIDRLAFILQGDHKRQFIKDVTAVKSEDTPLIFSRSPAAWHSHPRNYCEIEQFATSVGEWLFGKRLDFAWCHLALCTSRLAEVLAQVHNRDLSMLAEMTLAIREDVRQREVDWLEWEDPYLLNCPAPRLKLERESSVQETEKRLEYIIPTLQTLTKYCHR